jgi:hypothetical protein
MGAQYLNTMKNMAGVTGGKRNGRFVFKEYLSLFQK